MIIKDIFEKQIDREMRGVIKVDKGTGTNEREISERIAIEKQELEEYVVTSELQKHFATFFRNYKRGINGNTDKMGVWISGFFGSGKSHFLKILAELLANKEVAGKWALDYFKDGKKISDAMVIADMELAAKTSTDVILFNVDSKGESTGKQSKDAIVSIFLKAFNEMQGFCGSEPHIADLERRLVSEGKYEAFITAFEERAGSSWVEERNSPIFIQDELCDALSEVGLMSAEAARNFCEKSTEQYSISIEKFAEMVRKYIKKKGNNHHVVFLVDEIGQYIADNSALMLNLQTVTEDLGTACNGKAWVIVTSQQDIDSVTKTIGNDFSKIQGRFDTRLSLSSANADEVVKKRILSKNDVGAQSLKILYDEKSTEIKNKITFNDGIEKKLYSDRDNFSDVYPFIPYQFDLAGKVLTAIRTYSSSGKHQSDGERSLLALFKESAMDIRNDELGTLVPFYKLYDPVQEFIDHSHSIVIKNASRVEVLNPDHKEDCFAVNILKVLFMVKYVKEIKTTVENITSLMVSHIDEDRLALKSKVEEALKNLVRQTYVQKNGETYIFLTNEEQEINRAVEAMTIDPADKNKQIAEHFFDGILAITKYKYPAMNGRYSFNVNLFVDDKPYKVNQAYSMSLKLVTPNSGEATDAMILKLESGQSNSVIVALPNDRSFLDEITAVLQLEKFLNSDTTRGIAKFEQITTQKKIELREHRDNVRIYLKDAFSKAEIYVNGSVFQTAAKDPASKVNDAIGKLVEITYHKLNYIDTAMGENDILNVLSDQNQIVIDGVSGEPNSLALDEMRTYITRLSMQHTRISLKTLSQYFYAAPYGFNEADVQWLAAKLFKNGDIALWINNEPVTLLNRSKTEIVKYLTRKEFLEKLMLEVKKKAGEKQIKHVKETAKELFGVSITSDDEDSIMGDYMRYARNLKSEIDVLIEKCGQDGRYPGRKVLSDGRKLLLDILQYKFSGEFFTGVSSKRDELLDLAEDLEPIKKFFGGEQVKIWDKSLKYLEIYGESKTYIVNSEIEETAAAIEKIIHSSQPYGQIHLLPSLNEKFAELNTKLLSENAEPIYDVIAQSRARVFEALEGKLCKDTLKEKFINRFSELKDKAEHCNNIAKLKGIETEAEALKIRCLNEINAEERKLIPPEPAGDTPNSDIPAAPVKKRRSISIKMLSREASWEIETAADVEKYIEKLKQQIINQLDDDTIIHIEF